MFSSIQVWVTGKLSLIIIENICRYGFLLVYFVLFKALHLLYIVYSRQLFLVCLERSSRLNVTFVLTLLIELNGKRVKQTKDL